MKRWTARKLRAVADKLDPEPQGFYLSGFYWDEDGWVMTNPALTVKFHQVRK